MTDNPTELCEKLRLYGRFYGSRTLLDAAELIEAQAARIKKQALEYTSLFDQCSEAVARVAELEAQLERSNRLLAEVAALKRYDANAKKGYTAGLWITLSVPGNLLERIDAAISANKGEQE